MSIALPRPPRRAPFWDLHTPRGPSAGWSRHHCLSLDGSMAGMLGTKYTGGGKCASCQALAVELGWLDTVHSGPEPDGLRGDDAPDAVPTADKMPDATGGTMSSRTGRCYLAASLTGNARSARRPRCGSAKAATRTSAPQACLPGGPVSAGWVSGGGRCCADRSSAYYRF